MATVEVDLMKFADLHELEIESEARCYALLASKQQSRTKYDSPYLRCSFRDKRVVRDFMIWSNDGLLPLAEKWAEGGVYHLQVSLRLNKNRQPEFKLIAARPACDDDLSFYDLTDLYESSRYHADECVQSIRRIIREHISDPKVAQLVIAILEEQDELVRKMPAASHMHHAFTGGLIEHMWSIARISCWLAGHYGKYYHDLNPPLNKDVIIAAGIMHDLGKLVELEFHPVKAKYSISGQLIGHTVLGRDMVREAAAKIDGFPLETLLQLEHAILSHHGRKDYGAPVVPQTIEALIVSFADDLDAKVNMFAQARLRSTGSDPFTEAVYVSGENRRVYKGIPVDLTDLDANPEI